MAGIKLTNIQTQFDKTRRISKVSRRFFVRISCLLRILSDYIIYITRRNHLISLSSLKYVPRSFWRWGLFILLSGQILYCNLKIISKFFQDPFPGNSSVFPSCNSSVRFYADIGDGRILGNAFLIAIKQKIIPKHNNAQPNQNFIVQMHETDKN